MAFHHRKFLISEPKFSQKFTADDCYLCYVCPENCYLSPPPPQLSPPPPPPPPPPFPSPSQFSDANSSKNHVPTVLILMLCVLGVAFLVLSYLTLARYQRRRNPEPLEASRTNFIDENQGPILDHPIWYIRTVGLPQSVIDAIASFPYRKADGIIDGNDCAVCLNDFRDGEMLRLLPKCSHAFHLACIDTWLRSHKNCPVCRAHILAADAGNARVRGPTPLDSAPSSSGSGRAVTETRRRPERDELGSESTVDDNHNPIPSKNATIESDLDGDLQAVSVRRSVSMDFSNSSIYRVMRSSTSMKRSFSFSGKRSLRKSSRSSESILFSEIDMQNRGR